MTNEKPTLTDAEREALRREIVRRFRDRGIQANETGFVATVESAVDVIAARLAAVEAERDKAHAFNRRSEADKGRLWQALRDRCASAEQQLADLRAAITALADEWSANRSGQRRWHENVDDLSALLDNPTTGEPS